MDHICNHCGENMCSVVLRDKDDREVIPVIAYEPSPPERWFYVCPKCHNVQLYLADHEEE